MQEPMPLDLDQALQFENDSHRTSHTLQPLHFLLYLNLCPPIVPAGLFHGKLC
jgi:hypothetical protein